MVNFLVAGDIGAAANLVRNIMLLSADVDWPLTTSRFDTILNQYPTDLKTKLTDWIPIEERLRFSEKLYGVDISQDLDWVNYQRNIVAKNKPAVLINHSFVWQLDNFFIFASHMPSAVVMPTTDLGLAWQIRAYCEKKGVEIMHNFTFSDCIQEQTVAYIAQHGLESWYKENITNMKMIIKDRRDRAIAQIEPNLVIPLEWLIDHDNYMIIEWLKERFGIGIDFDQASQVLGAWRNLHWPTEQTQDWKYA